MNLLSRRFVLGIGLVCALIVGIRTAGQPTARPAAVALQATGEDDYTPLRLYDGGWDMEMSGPKEKEVVKMHIQNHCEKTGLFFVCEQMINRKTEDLVVFLPTGSSGNIHSYKTEGLSVSGEAPGEWGKLEIQGERWTYSSEETDKGTKVYWRTINQFSGPDKIHFEVQRSNDATNWETKRTGEERRTAK